jgi:saccharopepsin
MVGVYLSASEDDDRASQFSFGGFDVNHIKSGESAIRWHECVESDSSTSEPYWSLPSATMGLGSEDFDGSKLGVVLDTGSSLIGVPAWMAAIIYEVTGSSSDGSISCSRIHKLPDFRVTINGVDYTLKPQEYAYRAGFFSCHVGFVATSLESVILGDSFLLSYYSIYSIDRPQGLQPSSSAVHNWVGLAPVKPDRTLQSFPTSAILSSPVLFLIVIVAIMSALAILLNFCWRRLRRPPLSGQ